VPFELRSPVQLSLLGLLAPLILLYVLRMRRERRTVSSTWLWQAAQRDLLAKQPFRRLVPEVSLLLEALALAALALAFAGPNTRGGQIDSDHVAIVIDGSASMGSRTEAGPTRIERAREAANAVVQRLGPSADALIIEAAREARVVSPLERDKRRLASAIARVSAQEVEGDMARAVALASDHLRRRPGSSRIIVVTDGALAGPDPFATAALPLEVIRVARGADNAGIVRVDVGRAKAASGKEQIQAFGLIQNFGAAPRSLFVTLRQRNTESPLASRRLDLAPGEQAPVVLGFDAAPGDDGIGLVLELSPSDALAADDRAFIRAPPGERLPAVLAPKTASPWLKRALSSDPKLELFGASLEDLGRVEIPADAFIVVDGACPSHLPGADFLIVNPPVGTCLGAKVEPALRDPQITSWEEGDPRLRFLSFTGVSVSQSKRLVPDGSRASLVRAREGTLIADVSAAGRSGTLLGFDVGESNWPLKASFVLFVRNLAELARAHRAGAAMGPSRTGEPLPLRVPFTVSEVEVEGPDEQRTTLPAHEGLVVIPGPSRAGFYFASWKGTRPGSSLLAINLTSATEGDLAERPLALPGKRAVRERAAHDVADAVTDWSWVLAALALVLIAADITWLTRTPRMPLMPLGRPPLPNRLARGSA
jgi:hypothetical protein